MASTNTGPLRYSLDKPVAFRKSNDLPRETTKSNSTKDTGKKLPSKKESSKDKPALENLENLKLLKTGQKARSDSKSLTKSKKSLIAMKPKSSKNPHTSPKKAQKTEGLTNPNQTKSKGLVELLHVEKICQPEDLENACETNSGFFEST